MFSLFDDVKLDRHIRSLQNLTPPRRQRRKESALHLGTVCRWNRARGYGFLLADAQLDGIGDDREVYAHKSKLPKGVTHLERRQRVEFSLTPSHVAGKPPQAKVIRVIEQAKAA